MSSPGDWIGCPVDLSLKDGRWYRGVRLFAVDPAAGWLEADLGDRVERFLLRDVSAITLGPGAVPPPGTAALLVC